MAGFWSRMLGIDSYDAAQRVLSEPFEPFISTGGIPVMDPGSPLSLYGRAAVETFWRHQPALRKVVGFVARNVASIPLHTHERVSDTDRRRVTDHALPRVLSRPQPSVGAFRFWESVISDGLLYDRWAVLKDWQDDGSLQLLHIPSWRLYLSTDQFNRVVGAYMWTDDHEPLSTEGAGWIKLDLEQLIFDHGYAPRTAGLSPVETLKDLLEESAESVQYRRDAWNNGGRATQYIKRPMDAQWTSEQRSRFVEGLRKFMKDGSGAGGTMLLEDGMEIGSVPFMSPADALDLQGRELTNVEVSSAFHVSPELIGARAGNFSNVDAFRQNLYRDSLGPYITAWEQAINVGLTDDLAGDRNLYVEANVEAKLRGSFQEQAQVMQSATGRPWMTADEARARMNMPALGGDAAEIVTPLNVLVGGQASSRDSGSQNRTASKAGPVQYKAGPTANHDRKAEQVLSEFFAKQRRTIVSRLGANDVDWWDGDRWDDDLSARMLSLYLLTSTAAGQATLESIGIDPDSYDEPRTMAFLQKAARQSAESMNAATLAALQDAMAVDDDDEIPDPVDAASHVFDVAEDSRSAEAGLTAVAFAAGFGAVEAARQQTSRARKRWVVTSSNPRASHAAMHGEEVGIDDVFSSGQRWPGQYNGDPDDTAGCQCELEIIVD